MANGEWPNVNGSPYGTKLDSGPPGLAPKLLAFCEELRREGVAVGTSEILDAFAALDQVPWTVHDDFREALAATIAKSQEDRRLFELLFDRYFFRSAEAEAVQRQIGEGEQRHEGGERLDIDELRDAVRQAIVDGNDGDMRDLARLAISAFGRQGEGSGVIGVDVQRIRRTLGLQAGPQPSEGGEEAEIDREQLNHFERHLRRELERALIERTEALPPSRPLAELDRALPTSPAQDLAAVHRAVAQMKRRLATVGHERRGRRRGAVVDMRRTMRASLETGGVPLRLKHRPKRPRRPEIYVLCDVSTSVTSASVFFLSVLHALHDSFRRLRSFVFIERISEVTAVFDDQALQGLVGHPHAVRVLAAPRVEDPHRAHSVVGRALQDAVDVVHRLGPPVDGDPVPGARRLAVALLVIAARVGVAPAHVAARAQDVARRAHARALVVAGLGLGPFVGGLRPVPQPAGVVALAVEQAHHPRAAEAHAGALPALVVEVPPAVAVLHPPGDRAVPVHLVAGLQAHAVSAADLAEVLRVQVD